MGYYTKSTQPEKLIAISYTCICSNKNVASLARFHDVILTVYETMNIINIFYLDYYITPNITCVL